MTTNNTPLKNTSTENLVRWGVIALVVMVFLTTAVIVGPKLISGSAAVKDGAAKTIEDMDPNKPYVDAALGNSSAMDFMSNDNGYNILDSEVSNSGNGKMVVVYFEPTDNPGSTLFIKVAVVKESNGNYNTNLIDKGINW